MDRRLTNSENKELRPDTLNQLVPGSEAWMYLRLTDSQILQQLLLGGKAKVSTVVPCNRPWRPIGL
jgi:hypothetical protein